MHQGRERADEVAGRLGAGLREARQATGMTQQDLEKKAQISQPRISVMERGLGATVSLDKWAMAAAVVGKQLAAFLEDAAVTDRPRDCEHLKRQQLVIEAAGPGGWKALPEEPLDPDWERSRSIDVLLLRAVRHEATVVEIWNTFTDGGGAMRGLDGKVAKLERHLNRGRDLAAPMWRVSGLWVVRATKRNRDLVSEFRTLFAAKFPAAGPAWLDALASPAHAMPLGFGLVWTDAKGGRLMAAPSGSRRRTNDPPAST